MMHEDKTIYLSPKTKEKEKKEKEKKEKEREKEKEKEKNCRVVTETARWIKYISPNEDQQELFDLLYNHVKREEELDEREKAEYLQTLLQHKLSGYKLQDQRKNRFDAEIFVDISYVLEKLRDCEFHCFYCKSPVQIWYMMSREPKQWTLERIDNTKGHNKENVEIACLSCNLKRRCMYHERFRFTKQIQFVKCG